MSWPVAEGGQWRVGEAVEGAAGQGEAVWMVQEEEGVGKKAQLRSQAFQTPIRESELVRYENAKKMP